MVKHPDKVTWLTHQFRQVYDRLGTLLNDFANNEEDLRMRELMAQIGSKTLRECRKLYTISKNTAAGLKKYNGLDAIPLYNPPSWSADTVVMSTGSTSFL